MRGSTPSLGFAAFILSTIAVVAGISFWAAAAAFVAVAAILGTVHAIHRRDEIIRERTAKRLCLQCGYNLTGNVSGVCPECGRRA